MASFLQFTLLWDQVIYFHVYIKNYLDIKPNFKRENCFGLAFRCHDLEGTGLH